MNLIEALKSLFGGKKKDEEFVPTPVPTPQPSRQQPIPSPTVTVTQPQAPMPMPVPTPQQPPRVEQIAPKQESIADILRNNLDLVSGGIRQNITEPFQQQLEKDRKQQDAVINSLPAPIRVPLRIKTDVENKAKDFINDAVVSTVRAPFQAATSVMTPQGQKFTPTTETQKLLLGEDAIVNPIQRGKDWSKASGGIVPAPLAIGASVGLTALDAVPLGADDLARGVEKQAIKKIGINSIDDLAKAVAREYGQKAGGSVLQGTMDILEKLGTKYNIADKVLDAMDAGHVADKFSVSRSGKMTEFIFDEGFKAGKEPAIKVAEKIAKQPKIKVVSEELPIRKPPVSEIPAVPSPVVPPIEPPKPSIPNVLKETVVLPPAPPLSPPGVIAKAADDSLLGRAKSYGSELYRKTVNRLQPLETAAKDAGMETEMTRALGGYYGRNSKAEAIIMHDIKPLLQGVDRTDMKDLLIANRQLEKAGQDIATMGTNVATETAAANAKLLELQNKYGDGFEALQQKAKGLYDIQRKVFQEKLIDSGLVSKELGETILKENQSYIPFKRVFDEMEGKSFGPKGGLGEPRNPLKEMKGSKREIEDPFENIVKNVYVYSDVAERNNVMRNLAKISEVDPSSVRLAGAEAYNPDGVLKPDFLNRKDVMVYFENGKKVGAYVSPEIAEAIKAVGPASTNIFMQALQAGSSLLRTTATAANPEFFLPNVARDLQAAFVNVGLNPVAFVKGLASVLKKDELYEEFVRSGAKNSIVGDITATATDLFDSGKGVDASFFSRIISREDNPLIKGIQRMGELSEQPTRVAAFEKKLNEGLAAGLSREQAIQDAVVAAQESTVNFARSGADVQSLNRIVAFLNARIQGTDRLFRSIKADPVGAGVRLGLSTIAPALALQGWNQNFEAYNDPAVISESTKAKNWIIMLSEQPIDALGGVQYIKIPKAESAQMLANPVEQFIAYAVGKDSNIKDSIKKSFLSLSPVQNVGDAIPTALKPLVEAYFNKDFFRNQDVIPDYKASFKPKDQYTNQTSSIYKLAGETLGISPAIMQKVLNGYFTGYERLGASVLSGLSDALRPDLAQTTKDSAPINSVPVLRRFLAGQDRSEEEQITLYENNDKRISKQMQEIKAGVKRGDIAEQDGFDRLAELETQQKENEQRLQNYTSGNKGDAPNVEPVQPQIGNTTRDLPALTSNNNTPSGGSSQTTYVSSPTTKSGGIRLSRPSKAPKSSTLKVTIPSSTKTKLGTLQKIGTPPKKKLQLKLAKAKTRKAPRVRLTA